ncbi:MAG: hypothetical protein IJE50_05405 [Clostridia bacterium]|nr:hypothetical protein [Clostridia bacterium]MBQ4273067.1 hypothetical protein [Clostridia bacterium]
MKFSQMFELKGPTQENKNKKKSKKMPHEVFMGIMFIVCGYVQVVLFEIIEHAYGLPETNTFLDTCALLLFFFNAIATLLCFADRLYETKRKVAIVLIIFAIILFFFGVIFTIIDLVEVYNG